MNQPATPSSSPTPDLTRDLLARNFTARGGELLIGGVPVREIAGEFGTPLYVYDQALLAQSLRSLRDTLPPTFEVCYSVKANPNQAVLRYFVTNGCGLEIASRGELVQALDAGCPPEKILFAGPGKTQAEIDAAVEAGIGELHIESLTEARRVADAARRFNRTVAVAVRVNPSASIQGGGMRMGAKPAPFGIDEDQLEAALDQLQSEPALDVAGIHLYLGTQILDAQVLLAQYREFLAIARRAAASLKRPLRSIDFGGGWGIPYFAHETRLDLQAVRIGLVELAQELDADAALREARLIVEPGRFLMAEAGIYVTQVVDVKRSRDKTFVVVDGGMHQHLAASGNLGQTIKRNFPVAVLNRLDAAVAEPVDVVGPLCTPLDILARGVPLPAVVPGDLIGVLQSGAYGRTASPLGFLSHPAPPEVLVRAGQALLVRRRGRPEDTLSDQPLD
jgi:diaminopimelate decarboxylase